MTVHAEISIVPITVQNDTSMSKEIACAFEAIRKIKKHQGYPYGAWNSGRNQKPRERPSGCRGCLQSSKVCRRQARNIDS
jgi:hypothetical protein